MGNTLVKYNFGSPEEVFQRILISLGISRSLREMKTTFLSAEEEGKDLNLLSSFSGMKCEAYWNQWDSLVLKHLEMAENVEPAEIVHSKRFDFVDCILYLWITYEALYSDGLVCVMSESPKDFPW